MNQMSPRMSFNSHSRDSHEDVIEPKVLTSGLIECHEVESQDSWYGTLSHSGGYADLRTSRLRILLA